MIHLHVVAVLSVLSGALALVPNDGKTGRLPALGWNSWNAYNCDINEEKILSAASDLKSLGLQDAGYEYVNIDDCWSVKSERDKTTGRIMPNTTRFPNGIDGLADKLHGLGFKIGIYSDAGTQTCAGYPGSLYNEDIDAKTFAEWGIDYLKHDNCNIPSSWSGDEYNNCHPDYDNPTGPNGTCVNDARLAPAGYDWSTSSTAKRYNRMRDALKAQNRTILYSLCEWGTAGVQTWGNDTAQSWRITGDISADWSSVIHIINYNSFHLNYVNFFGHNDADMLEIGNGALTLSEQRTHFSIWAAMKSPLLVGTNLTGLSSSELAILKNKYLLSFNQDPVHGEPATPYKWGTNPDWTYNDTNPAEYWSGNYKNGKMVFLVNYSGNSRTMSAVWGEVPGTKKGESYEVVDAWTGNYLGCNANKTDVAVGSHDTAVLVVTERQYV